jgi:cation diffusion facilitator family transporter
MVKPCGYAKPLQSDEETRWLADLAGTPRTTPAAEELQQSPGNEIQRLRSFMNAKQLKPTSGQTRPSLARYAWLSVAAAVITIGLKTVAYLLTGSVGLLSDAMESFINLVGAVMMMAMLAIAARPADEEHTYGHDKAEYFASGVEGVLIVIAAISIGRAAWERLLNPQPVEQVALGLAVSVAASLVNLVVARILIKAGRQHNSIALDADGHHLMVDVWTSVGVIVGVALAALTGWVRVDPLVGLAVAVNIIWTGWKLIKRTVAGLMDTALPQPEQEAIRTVLAAYQPEGIQFDALRTRQAAGRRFVSMDILAPGTWSIRQGHQLLERLERDLYQLWPMVTVFTHLEPLEDAHSQQDETLDRSEPPS